MAYVNVAEWSPDQVSEWLKGLDEVILPYIHYFVNNQVDGKRLLQLSPDDLPSLRVTKIGHQEIVLQAVELLRNVHYQLNQENVQHLALRLSSKARSIYNELRQTSSLSIDGGGSAGEEEDDEEEGAERRNAKKRQERVSTAIIAGVADVLSSVKGLVSWLNRQPFEGQEKYDCLKGNLVELSIRLATITQRDMFAENQATVILQLCFNLALISDQIIQEYNDPLVIQPASLDIATVKKKADDEWGVLLQSSYQGVHQVSGVRAMSPAFQCGKLQEGDELVQVNYQTVIGWSPHKVTAVMQEFPVEVILTVKKRPRHANTVTQIYLKPMRLPSKKRTYSPWGSSLIASPRYDLQSIPNLQLSLSVDKVPIKQEPRREPPPKALTPPPQMATPSPRPASSISDAPSTASDRESQDSEEEDDAFLSDGDLHGSSPVSVRLYHPKPRAPVQRRATIPGASARPSLSFDQLLQDVRWSRGRGGLPEGSTPSNPDLLRGADHRAARPHTCIGTEDKMRKKEEEEEEDEEEDDEGEKVDDDKEEGEKVVNVIPLPPRKPTGQPKLDKSHSTPAYDMNGDEASASRERFSASRKQAIANQGEITTTQPHHCGSKAGEGPCCNEGGGNHALEGRGSGLGGAESTIAPSPPSSSSAAVVLRETRSSSPSVWRRGLLVTDQGSRRISCRELGQGDHQGWLYRRRDNKGFLLPHRWERRWFILKKNYLYGYRDREAVRADSLIYLPGFHVCPASDVKGKKFAFKIYHSSGATFYFACETSEERSRWMSQMGLSAISSLALQQRQPPGTQQHQQQQQQGDEVYYSETDEELEERSSPSRRSPQSSQPRVSPSKENVGSPWRGGSASPSRGAPSRGPPLGSLAGLGSGKGQGLRFLQPSRDTLNQPVPTASFRSYRRVSENSSRSTSTGDLRGVSKSESSAVQGAAEGGTGRRVARKNSLRDRLRQLPASFERRRQASRSAHNDEGRQRREAGEPQKEEGEPPQQTTTHKIATPSPDEAEIGSQSCESGDVFLGSQRPHYMLPTCASSQHSPLRPSSIDLDARSAAPNKGKWVGTPPSSGRCSPSKLESGRRGSTGGESPVRSRSPRRGSLDCLSHPRAVSPPTSPLHGSTSSLLASEEYREGSPEKLWISSLRTDRPKLNARPEKRDSKSSTSERLKRAALYHPPQLRSRGDPMRAAFELVLDPSCGVIVDSKLPTAQLDAPSPTNQWETIGTPKKAQQILGRATSPPEVPPRTKFLSPSERTLPSSLSASTSTLPAGSPSSSPSTLASSTKSTSSLPALPSSHPPHSAVSSPDSPAPARSRTAKLVPNLTIRTHGDEAEASRTPLKPTMGVSMIGKQRRTPSVVSPREIFFSSPPSSPTTPNQPPGSGSASVLTTATCVVTSYPQNLAKGSIPSKMHNQKILPHYPGMEYPPVFEPGSYSLCGSPPDQPLHQVTNVAAAAPHPADQAGEIPGSRADVAPLEAAQGGTAGGVPPSGTSAPAAPRETTVPIGSGTHHPTSTSVSISRQSLCVSTHQNVYVTTPVQSSGPSHGAEDVPPLPTSTQTESSV